MGTETFFFSFHTVKWSNWKEKEKIFQFKLQGKAIGFDEINFCVMFRSEKKEPKSKDIELNESQYWKMWKNWFYFCIEYNYFNQPNKINSKSPVFLSTQKNAVGKKKVRKQKGKNPINTHHSYVNWICNRMFQL